MNKILAALFCLFASSAFAQVDPSPHLQNLQVDGTVSGAGFSNYLTNQLLLPHTIAGTWAGTPLDLSTQVSGNLPIANLGGGTGATSVTFWRGDGTWAVPPTGGGGGGGSVTTASWIGGIVSIGTPTTTPTFTIAGTSGGIPYFSSASGWASSPVLASGSLVQGGGAAAPPTTFTLGGDCTLISPNIMCTKTGGVAFGNLATLSAAPAGTLTGGVLAGNVLQSSLTGLGPLTSLAVTGQATFSDRPRSLQSFGAVDDPTLAADSAAAIQTAMNSGKPLICNGTFAINSLVTITNVSLYMVGGHQGCKLVLNNAQSMFYFTLTGSSIFSRNTVFIRDVYVSVTTAITAVAGPAQTAAFYISYPAGSAGTVSPLIDIKNVQIQGSAPGNYVQNCFYINDAVYVEVDHLTCEGNRSVFTPSTNGIVFDGTHTPALFDVENSFMDFVGNGILAKAVSSSGWQGLRVRGLHCYYCNVSVNAIGSPGGLADQLIVRDSEGPVQSSGVVTQNVAHVSITGNYIFLSDIPISGGSHTFFPVCYEDIRTIAIPANGGTTDISGNNCDGAQVTGYTARYGVSFVNTTSSLGMASHIGVNMLTTLDFGIGLGTSTTGIVVEKQTMKGVTTELQDLGAAGANIYVPPLARTDGAAAPVGRIGEVQTLFVPVGSSVSQPGAGAINIGTVPAGLPLTAGNWNCNGAVWTDPSGGTTTSILYGALSTTSATLPVAGSIGIGVNSSAVPAGTAESVNFGPMVLLVSAPTNLYLVGQAVFAVSTMKLYGSAQCVRYM